MKMKRRNRVMIVFGVICIVAGSVLIYWNISYSPFKTVFDKEMKNRMSNSAENDGICMQKEIDQLPEAFKRHSEYIGLAGTNKNNVVNAVFHNTRFVFDDKKDMILNMDYDLWLFCDNPFRSAFCKSSLFGIPFDGIDYFTDDKEGGMKGMIGKAFQIFDTHNEQMYKAGLISLLAEGAAINPSILVSEHVTYKELDSTHVKATIHYNGVEGTGVFIFDERGILECFESDERQVEEINGIMTPIGWKATYEDYTEKEGLMVPGTIRVIKVYPEKEVVYFDANDIDIYYYK